MAWTNIAKRAVGACIPKSWLDSFIDNLTHLYNLAGGSGTGAGGSLINGSFENDVDINGVPDGWTWTAYTGGTLAIDATDQAHGATAAKITSPGGSGNGGGTLTSTDFLVCSPTEVFSFAGALKSSVAGVHNVIDVLWFDHAKDACTTVSTNVYDDAAHNPTASRAMTFHAVPPDDARFAKIRLTGCKNDDTTAGSTWFDGFRLIEYAHPTGGWLDIGGGIPETSVPQVWTDIGDPFEVYFGGLEGDTVYFRVAVAARGAYSPMVRLRIGTTYSTELQLGKVANTYEGGMFEMSRSIASAADHHEQICVQGANGGGTAYLKVDWNSASILIDNGQHAEIKAGLAAHQAYIDDLLSQLQALGGA